VKAAGFIRHPRNPILTAADLPFDAHSVFNPGACVLRDGRVGLLLRVEDKRGLSSIYLARSTDGVAGWRVDPTPLLQPEPKSVTSEWGYEDARVSFLPELDRYVITCTAYGRTGPSVYLAISEDLTSLDARELILPPEDKNAAVLPRRVGGQWLLLHRPVVMARATADIWISRSDDLFSWRHPEQVMLARPGGFWDSTRVGIGPPPLETEHGWLLIYHGVRNNVAGALYRVGAALLDLDQPWRVVRRLDEYLLAPDEGYERFGDVDNIVFPCGMVTAGDRLQIYYGAADTVTCTASISTSDLVARLVESPPVTSWPSA
jgi:predicted GH43/DUF377 family glycosyl hydrolase